MKEHLYVRFRFNYLRLTLYSADGKQLMLVILATILSITTPTTSIFPEGWPIHLAILHIFPGILSDVGYYPLLPGKPSQVRYHVGNFCK